MRTGDGTPNVSMVCRSAAADSSAVKSSSGVGLTITLHRSIGSGGDSVFFFLPNK